MRHSYPCSALLTVVALGTIAGLPAAEMDRIRVAPDGRSFATESGRAFLPWGFNYDHDEEGRLIEDYWVEEWDKVAQDFAEMRGLGANAVRVHLQFGRFMAAADEPNEASLAQLGRLLDLAEETGLYLDLTGLGCYHKRDVPAWYDALDETARWQAQARFWEAVAARCAESPAVFCYDLMNEPVVSGGKRAPGEWLGPPFGDKHFVQFVSLDPAGRPRPQVAREWVDALVAAIRRRDEQTLVTVGLVPWSLDRPGLSSGFVPAEIAAGLDFLCVHLYPETDAVDAELETLRGFDVGKPVVIEEMFPLKCPFEQFEDFVARSRPTASGWIGFYWGRTPDEYRGGKTIVDALMLRWLEYFEREAATAGELP